jgi:hypothetical protein
MMKMMMMMMMRSKRSPREDITFPYLLCGT